MTTKTRLFIVLTSLALGIAGCQGPQPTTPGGIVIGEDTVTIEQLALRLGLRIEQRDETSVVMKNAANTVIVFTHTDGRFFVNGKPMGSVGSVTNDHGVIRVPSTLVEQIRPFLRTNVPQATKPARTGAVIIDAGHGGHDPGTSSVTGEDEKNINLRVAAKVARLLEQRGVAAVMTRWQDEYIEKPERAAIGNRRKAALFVSIHADSAPSSSAQGFTVYVSRSASSESYRAAHAVNQAMEKTGMNNRGVREADYVVLVQSKGPAILIELGYLSSPQDAARLSDDRFRDRMAQAIADGIQAFLK
ncbi:MAG: N-acetylmuramoyl-L-alanine amidase [Phycisphaerales bacterium]|jgi:N-acetylmuramoyl-L-alanine amidase